MPTTPIGVNDRSGGEGFAKGPCLGGLLFDGELC
jgi:hypothetical protein